jgi:hypothetical protein
MPSFRDKRKILNDDYVDNGYGESGFYVANMFWVIK